MYAEFDLRSYGIATAREFIAEYERINEWLWGRYRAHQIDKATLRNTRFIKVLNHWLISDDPLAAKLNDFYLAESPRKPHLMEGAREAIGYLSEKYALHIITNGFVEVQQVKMTHCGIEPFFKNVVISELVGFPKPDPRIFAHALELSRASVQESIYIGDHPESDINGSKQAGWDQVFFNPSGKMHSLEPTFEIRSLNELQDLF